MLCLTFLFFFVLTNLNFLCFGCYEIRSIDTEFLVNTMYILFMCIQGKLYVMPGEIFEKKGDIERKQNNALCEKTKCLSL